MPWELDYLRAQRSEAGEVLSYSAAVRQGEETLPVRLTVSHPAVAKLELLLAACQQGEVTREEVAAYLATYAARTAVVAAEPVAKPSESQSLEACPVAVVLKSGEAFEALLVGQDGLWLKLLQDKKPRALAMREIASLDYL